MANWFKENPVQSPSLFNQLGWDMHLQGRQHFASNYAAGGMSSSFFAPTARERFSAPWQKKIAVGSPEHIQRLEQLKNLHPGSKDISKALNKSRAMQKSGNVGKVGWAGKGLKIAGGAFAVGYVLSDINPNKDIITNARTVARGAASWTGFGIGSVTGAKLGMGIGAAIGGPIGGIIGGAIGFMGGGLIGEEALTAMVDGPLGITDAMAKREKDRRALFIHGDRSAFNTQQAATMRQQSLMMMNRGQMSSRSLLGQEAVFTHV